jgi:hypothetical protein
MVKGGSTTWSAGHFHTGWSLTPTRTETSDSMLLFSTSSGFDSTTLSSLEHDQLTLPPLSGGGSAHGGMLLFDAMIHNPIFWSTSVMLTIVGLLLLWENCVEYARENTPKAIVPVIESMLVEMGSLGFIGIVISVLLNRIALGETVGQLSEEYLGERELLFESFEYLHEAFFQVGILFFAAAGTIVVRVLQKLNQITSIAEKQLGNNGEQDCEGGAVAERLAGILNVYTLPADCRIIFDDNDVILTDDECSIRDYEAMWLVRKVDGAARSRDSRHPRTTDPRARFASHIQDRRIFGECLCQKQDGNCGSVAAVLASNYSSHCAVECS